MSPVVEHPVHCQVCTLLRCADQTRVGACAGCKNAVLAESVAAPAINSNQREGTGPKRPTSVGAGMLQTDSGGRSLKAGGMGCVWRKIQTSPAQRPPSNSSPLGKSVSKRPNGNAALKALVKWGAKVNGVALGVSSSSSKCETEN